MWPGLCISDGKMQGGKRILTEQEFSAISPLPLKKKKTVDNYSLIEKCWVFFVVMGMIYEQYIL